MDHRVDLTCSLPFAGKEIQAGIAVDQMVANAIGANTRFASTAARLRRRHPER
jgi:hypothetical protein